jgi:hypothetical protein
MPDIARQAKVDLGPILEVVKRYGDRRFWNGAYQEAMLEATQQGRTPEALKSPAQPELHRQPCIPLLVYHSNLISGGFGGSESLLEKTWRGAPVSYINVSKFRSIGEQQQLLSLLSGAEHAYAQLLRAVSRDSDIYTFFLHASAPSDAGNCLMCFDCLLKRLLQC